MLNALCWMRKRSTHPEEAWGSGEEKIKEGIVKNGQGLSYGKFGQLKGHQWWTLHLDLERLRTGFPEEASFISDLKDEYSWGVEKWEWVGMCSSQAITVWLEHPVPGEGREETRKVSPGSIREGIWTSWYEQWQSSGDVNKGRWWSDFRNILNILDLEIFCLQHKGYIRGQ